MRMALLSGVLLAVILHVASCTEVSPEVLVPTTTSTTTSTSTTLLIETIKPCETLPSLEKLVGRQLALPATGRLVLEDHHTPRGAKQPANSTDGITKHLSGSCEAIRALQLTTSNDCADIYNASYKRKWTPAEGGGRVGSVATQLKPTDAEELWLFNMYWSAKGKPPTGYKYLITNIANGRSVVVAGGYEIGPAGSSYMGGLSTEGHWYLKSDNSTLLRFARLKDQTQKLGPINCEVKL